MPTVGTYFTTKLAQFNTKGDQVAGLWNITHNSLFDPLYTKKKFRTAQYNLTWIELRKVFNAIALDQQWDKEMVDEIKMKTVDRIPVRSGKLLDTIFKSLRIDRFSWYRTHYLIDMLYDYPSDRPDIIPGRTAHTNPPDTGYGKWGTVKLITKEAKSRVQWLYTTPYGALYRLNDPLAEKDPKKIMADVGSQVLLDDTIDRFSITLEVLL